MNKQPTLLVTGAAGFIGSRLVEKLTECGISVVSVDRKSHFDERVEHHGIPYGLIVDRDALFAWLADHEPFLNGIVHLGACTDTTLPDVATFDRVNVEYSKRLWTYARDSGQPFLYASSAATYGDGSVGYDDDESRIGELRALNPYGDSKQSFDLWALARARAGEAPPCWCGFKFFNVYGFGERHKANMASVVLKATDQIRADGKVRLFRSHHPDYRDGEQMRDFVWVDDVVDILRFAWEKPLSRGIFNIGTGRARTFLDLVRAVFSALDVPERIEFVDTPPSIREQYQYFTEARMVRLIEAGYTKPMTSLEDGVTRYVERLIRIEAEGSRSR